MKTRENACVAFGADDPAHGQMDKRCVCLWILRHTLRLFCLVLIQQSACVSTVESPSAIATNASTRGDLGSPETDNEAIDELPTVGELVELKDTSPTTLAAALSQGKVLGVTRWCPDECFLCVALQEPLEPASRVPLAGCRVLYYEEASQSDGEPNLLLRYSYRVEAPQSFAGFLPFPGESSWDNLGVVLNSATADNWYVVFRKRGDGIRCIWEDSGWLIPERVDLDNDGHQELISTRGDRPQWDPGATRPWRLPDEAWIYKFVGDRYARVAVVPWEDRLSARSFAPTFLQTRDGEQTHNRHGQAPSARVSGSRD